MNVIHWSSSAPKQVICGSKIDHLMTTVSQKQQYIQSFALNQSHDRKQGGGDDVILLDMMVEYELDLSGRV